MTQSDNGSTGVFHQTNLSNTKQGQTTLPSNSRERFSESEIASTGLINTQQKSKRPNFIMMGIFFSVVYWVLEAVRGVIAFDGSFMKYMFMPNALDLGMRLMVVSIILLFSAFTHSRTSKSDERQFVLIKWMGRLNFIWAGLIFGMVYWILEGVRDVMIFGEEDVVKQVFLPDPMGFWMRVLALCVLILFGIYIESLIQDRERTEAALKKLQDELDMKIARRTDTLAQENAIVKEQMHLLRDQMANHQNIYHEKRAMIRQAYHVMKSTLQSLSDIVDRQIRKSENDQSKKEMFLMQTRISAISLVYSQFYQNQNTETMDMARFFRDTTDYLSKVYFRKTIYLDIKHGECEVPLSKAVVCAMVFIEIFLGVYEQHDTASLQIRLDGCLEHRVVIEIRNKGEMTLNYMDNPGYVWGAEVISQQLSGSLYLTGTNNQDIHMEFIV